MQKFKQFHHFWTFNFHEFVQICKNSSNFIIFILQTSTFGVLQSDWPFGLCSSFGEYVFPVSNCGPILCSVIFPRLWATGGGLSVGKFAHCYKLFNFTKYNAEVNKLLDRCSVSFCLWWRSNYLSNLILFPKPKQI